MTQDNTHLAPYWLELYRKADEARDRKEAVALLREAQRLSDRTRRTGFIDDTY